MDKIKAVKTVTEVVVSVGVGAIVANGVRVSTPGMSGLFKKVFIGVGAFVLTSMVTEKAVDYAEKKIDKIVDYIKEIKDEVEELQEGIKFDSEEQEDLKKLKETEEHPKDVKDVKNEKKKVVHEAELVKA